MPVNCVLIEEYKNLTSELNQLSTSESGVLSPGSTDVITRHSATPDFS